MIALPIYSSGADSGQTYTVSPSKIIALGLNYRDHIAESESVRVQGFTKDIPEEPILFAKTPNVLIGPEEPIVLPAFARSYGFPEFRVDHEAELALEVARREGDLGRLGERIGDLEQSRAETLARIDSLDQEEASLRDAEAAVASLRKRGAEETEILFGQRDPHEIQPYEAPSKPGTSDQ